MSPAEEIKPDAPASRPAAELDSTAAYPCPVSNQISPAFSGRQDLLGVFDLLPLYDHFVRPYKKAAQDSVNDTEPADQTDKFKPVDITLGMPAWSVGPSKKAATLGQPSSPSQPDGRKNKMDKSLYAYAMDEPAYVKPAKDSQTHLLQDLLFDPNKEPGPIHDFDESAIREAFTLKAGVLPGFDPATWSKTYRDSKTRKLRKHARTDTLTDDNRDRKRIRPS
ncbi:uncharacterized protein L969DRAFT_86760 [Mixia osmundae IAM 14324]|uniref:Mediator of RNA polymerase II transcription subunit 19 n=1 Tax=Mixia osmundae (strain CBS 9802 / IAM 14324 / JCM 22182 / KY 12970) TaxID=764103 RepID=G7E8N3_MIXOS|nr:uncharacterized protein L969DRAFT_86760 [Mixia osmundae IAM 14324]KEI40135.1 hypothetical protein L969DRAFT_86760 [Mixia osmundae IAM 14324]GAA99501.1 hypothetical protein E5Q_06201 [Mixia osmundae IAM 14324]